MPTLVAPYVDEMIQMRRRLHRYPEIAWTEFVTTSIIVERVRALGFKTVLGKKLFNEEFVLGRDPQIAKEAEDRARAQGVSEEILKELEGYTGCLAVWETGRPGPVTALRFDIDCIPVQENQTDANEAHRDGYESTRDGLMHACGHDGHASMGMTVAHWVHDHADELCGTIKIIFQPAEEGTKGACGIAHSNNLDDVDYLIGGHVNIANKVHDVSIVRKGFLATTKMNASFTGLAAHAGGSPELGRNALMAACSAAMQIMGIARHGQGATSVNVGVIHAGEGRNVVPAHAGMEIEVRGSNAEINSYMQERAEAMVRGSAMSYGVDYRLDVVGKAEDVVSDEELVQAIVEAAKAVDTVENIHIVESCGGSEDHSLLMHAVQKHGGKAVFFGYGGNGTVAHSSLFQIQDTETLPIGLEIFVRLLTKYNVKA